MTLFNLSYNDVDSFVQDVYDEVKKDNDDKSLSWDLDSKPIS